MRGYQCFAANVTGTHWCENHLEKLRNYIPLKSGIASEPTISRMLSGIDDNVFTIDAIGTPKKMEEQIVDGGGHFVLQVKKNTHILYEEITSAFATFEKDSLGKDDIQIVGLISDMKLSAKELADYKRAH